MSDGCSHSHVHDCREVLERAQVFLDGEVLAETERLEIQQHLEECGPCYKRYGIEREVRVIISRLRGCSPCPEELRSRIQSLLDEA